MIKKKLLTTVAICGALGCAIGAVAIGRGLAKRKGLDFIHSDGGEITLTLDGSNTPAALESSYTRNATGTITTADGNDITLNFVYGKAVDGAFAQLAPTGMIYNYNAADTYKSKFDGLKSVTVAFTGDLSIQYSTRPDGKMLSKPHALTSGTAFEIPGDEPFFRLVAGDSGAVLNSIDLKYTCLAGASYAAADLAGTWTGIDVNDTYFKMVVQENGDTTIDTLNDEDNKHFEGVSVKSGDKRMTCTFKAYGYDVHYTMDIGDDGNVLTFVSKTDDVGGAVVENISKINAFYRVYGLDDFESYSGQGVGWDSNASGRTEFTTSGLRGAYYADYYGNNTIPSPIGGSGWSMMGSADYLKYTADKGRNGSAAASFKGNGNSLRYLQKKALYGSNDIAFKGSTFSFWVKGPFKSDLTTAATVDAKVKVYAYYNNPVTPSNQGTRTEKEFTIPAGSDWTRLTMDLDSSKEYYSYGFFCKQSGDTYTIIDDIEVYTVNPYEVYNPDAVYYPSGTFTGTVSAAGTNLQMVISMANTGQAIVRVGGQDMGAGTPSYDPDTGAFSIPTTGGYAGMNVGNVTGILDKMNGQITNVGCDGPIGTYVTDNNNLTFGHPGVYVDCEGTTAQMQAMWKRRYDSGSGWQTDTGNTDRVAQNTSNFIDGNSSMSARVWSGGKVALTLNQAYELNNNAAAQSARSIAFWMYNPNAEDFDVQLFIYKATNNQSNAMLDPSSAANYTAKAGQWSYITASFANKISEGDVIYNIQIVLKWGITQYPLFDNIAMY